jgi:hypothetical protein
MLLRLLLYELRGHGRTKVLNLKITPVRIKNQIITIKCIVKGARILIKLRN